MIKEATNKLILRRDLTLSETQGVFREIFEEKATLIQIAAFLAALKTKGETYEEIAAAASVVREKALKINVTGGTSGDVVFDPVGTGGAGVHAFNISTAVAFIVAASGIKVAKHGNRAASSHCGSADVLEFMGIPMDTPPRITQEAIKKIGVGFLFAPTFHPAFKVVAPVRTQIGIKTIFNILGPLCNPAQANVQLLGVFHPDLLEPMARALKYLGGRRAFVVYGEAVKDEVSLMGATRVVFLHNKSIKKISFYPSHFGLKKCSLAQIEVKDAKESARVITDILRGKKGPHLDIVLANAAASFLLLNKVKDLKAGVRVARQLVESGKAKEKFLALKRFLGEHHEL